MNDQSLATTSTLKRKRGRPRRDGSLKQGKEIVAVQEWGGSGVDESSEIEEEDDELLGQVVSGVLSGSFDAGYFVPMKPQNNGADADAALQGRVFYPGKVVPVASENDLAPHVKLCKRQEYDITSLSPLLSGCSGTIARM
uniref:Uncharacterized protein n=1 Tax=Kalanchoe fedtschenkoi TaxID=63787 RepID=A0A7N0REP2_KALFE